MWDKELKVLCKKFKCFLIFSNPLQIWLYGFIQIKKYRKKAVTEWWVPSFIWTFEKKHKPSVQEGHSCPIHRVTEAHTA